MGYRDCHAKLGGGVSPMGGNAMTPEMTSTVDRLPLISCIMPTYGRPRYVHEAAKMFLDQDYPAKELIILNDCAGQDFYSELPNIRVINSPRRYSTLGEKRNECIKQARGEFLAIWDDDDVYLPWRLSYSLAEINRWRTDFYRPAEFLAYWGEDSLHDNQTVPGWLSHPTVLLRKRLWERVGGYAAMNVGEDAEFFARIHKHLGQEFLKYAIRNSDRFMILRGKSRYRHMSIGGGIEPSDTTAGEYHIQPRPIADPCLRRIVKRLIATREEARASGGAAPTHPMPSTSSDAWTPILSVCVSVKNRSRLRYGESELEPFPNCVRSLRAATESVGPLELVVADFQSDDWPLADWLQSYSTDKFRIRIVTVAGPFSRGRGLNVAARNATCDNLFLCDADILVSSEALTYGSEMLGLGKVSFPICRYTHEDARLAFWQNHGFGLVFVHRTHLDAVGGVPEFESWGGEDDLLRDRLKHRVAIARERVAGLFHQWHPDHCRHSNYRRAAKADFNAVPSQSQTSPTFHRKYHAQHPYWNGPTHEILLYTNGRMERPGIDAGTYELEDRVRLVLRWDKWPPEVLDWNPESQRFHDRTKPFTLVEAKSSGDARVLDVKQALAATRSEFAALGNHLKSLAPFQFLSAPGNWGDAIIRSGTLRFFDELDVEYHELSHAGEARSNLPAVLGGSGGFCRYWNWSPRAARQLQELSRELVVLPSSFEAASLAWNEDKAGSTFYAREDESLRQIQDRCRVYFCPDMAFWNDTSGYSAPTVEILNAFRTDAESLGMFRRHSHNRDLSAEHDATGNSQQFFAQIAKYSTIRTDRAHVAIAAAMLGRTVALYPNAYHKNSAIFRSGLSRFNVTWNATTD
ncbi:MAG: glycosyltransferase [Planctomycetota bacterium]